MSDSGLNPVICVFIFIFVAILMCCESAFKHAKKSVPAYSTPIAATSRTRRPPGSSQANRLRNGNSSSSGFARRSSSPAAIPSMPCPQAGFIIPGSQVNSSARYPLINAGSSYPHSQEAPYPPQTSFPQHMPLPSHLQYPPSTMYPPQDVPNVTQRSNTPQPSAPFFSPSSEDMDVPPNYDEAMTILSKEQKKC